MATKRQIERHDALTQLAKFVKPGDTVYTILRHVSRSGMSRVIDVYAIDGDGPHWLSGYTSTALDWRLSRKPEGIKVGGCGMDMGFHLVYTLSRVLYPDGFECIGDKCPSNDHSNARFYRARNEPVPTRHSDGGYALRHRWM